MKKIKTLFLLLFIIDFSSANGQNNVTLGGKGNDTVSCEWLVNSNFNGTLMLHITTASIQKSSNFIHFKSKCK